jgi:Rrf2 family nitric oxide-sensitive transcriptional repressor
MRLAAFTDYGLRVLMRLADKSDEPDEPDEPMTTSDIARQFRIPYNHLAKVVQDLARGNFVLTQRGASGGIRLARPAETITLGEVVRFLEQRYALTECFRADGGACLLTPRCRLKSRLAAGHEAFLAELNKTSIAACAFPGLKTDKSLAKTAHKKSDRHFAKGRRPKQHFGPAG